MNANKKRDPATDPDATVRDFVFRLRRMGYPGNLRVEFPIYTPQDVRWIATLLEDAARELVQIVRSMPPGGGRIPDPLRYVLEARGAITRLDAAVKRNTTHAEAKRALIDERMREAHHG